MQNCPSLQELFGAFAPQRAKFWIPRRSCQKREAADQKASIIRKALLPLADPIKKVQAAFDRRINLSRRIKHEINAPAVEIIDKPQTNLYTLRMCNWSPSAVKRETSNSYRKEDVNGRFT